MAVSSRANFTLGVFLLMQALVRIYRVVFKIESGMSSTIVVEHALIETPVPIESVRDVKFVDDEALMIAFSDDCQCFYCSKI